MDLQKIKAAAIALRDNNCEENYIEHINQSCPANVLELIAQCEHINTNKQAPIGHIQVDTEHDYSFIAGDGVDDLTDGRHAVYLQNEQQSWDESAYKSMCDNLELMRKRAETAEFALERIQNELSPTHMGEPLLQSPAVAVPDADFIASTLMDAWKNAEPDHGITANITSYVATFADMARAVIRAHFAQSPRITEQEFSDDEYICIRDAVDRLISAVGKDVDGDQSECSLCAEFIDELIKNVITPLKITWLEDDEWCGYVHSVSERTTEPSELVKELYAPYPHPRISEQDAREVAKAFNIFRSQGHGPHPDGIVNKWLRSDEGRALLDKLNATDTNVGTIKNHCTCFAEFDAWQVAEGNKCEFCKTNGDSSE